MSALLTERDLSDAENVTQARHELHRAQTDAALAAWARKWGDSCIVRAEAAVGMESDASDDLASVEKELRKAEDKIDALQDANTKAIRQLEGLGGDPTLMEKVYAICELLETA